MPMAERLCAVRLWRYSHHPNYIGEIIVRFGMFLTMFPFAPEKWHYIVSAVIVAAFFNFMSIPMMEENQLARYPDYAEYQKTI